MSKIPNSDPDKDWSLKNCLKKQVFTETEAQNRVIRMNRMGTKKMRHYLCQHCGKHHLTSSSPKDYFDIRNKKPLTN